MEQKRSTGGWQAGEQKACAWQGTIFHSALEEKWMIMQKWLRKCQTIWTTREAEKTWVRLSHNDILWWWVTSSKLQDIWGSTNLSRVMGPMWKWMMKLYQMAAEGVKARTWQRKGKCYPSACLSSSRRDEIYEQPGGWAGHYWTEWKQWIDTDDTSKR